MNNLFLIVLNFLYYVTVLLVGNFLIRYLNLKLVFSNRTEEKIYAFAFGNIFYSLSFIYLGFAHLLYPQIIFLLYLLPIIFYLFARSRKFLIKKPWQDLALTFNKKFSVKQLIFFSFLAVPLLPIFPHLFSFPTSWDVLAYHLALPKMYLNDHQLSFYYWFAQTSFPVGIESLFSIGEIFREPRISNFIVFDFMVMTIIYFVYGLRSLAKLRVLLLAVTLFLFRKILYTEVSFNPFVDLPFAFYGLLISISCFKFFEKGRTQDLIIAFCLCLFTILIKFTGIMIAFSFITTMFLFFISLSDKERKRIIVFITNRKSLLISLTLAIPIVLQFLRNYFYTGNPVSPFLNNIFKGLYYNEVDSMAMMADLRSQNLTFDMISGLLLRLGKETAGTILILRESLFSFVLILFTILSLFSKTRAIRYSAIFSLIFFGLVVWLVGFPSYRYTLPLIPLMALLASFTFWNLLERHRLIHLGFIVIFVYALVVQISSTYGYGREFFFLYFKTGLKSMLNYAEVKQGLALQDNWQAVNFINQTLDKDKDKVLILFDNRLYYYQIPVVYSDPAVSPFFLNRGLSNPQEISDELKKEKITHLMVNTNWGKPAKLNNLLYEQFLKEGTILEASYSGTKVYKIK